MSHKDRPRFPHAAPRPIEGLGPDHADIQVPTFRSGLWRFH